MHSRVIRYFGGGFYLWQPKNFGCCILRNTRAKAELDRVIADHKDIGGALMPVLQKAQDIYGYLPIEVQTMVAEGLNVPLEKVYGVATFLFPVFALSKGKI